MNQSQWSPPSLSPANRKVRLSGAETPPAVALWYSRLILNVAFLA